MAAALSCMAYAAASHRLMYGVVLPHLDCVFYLSTSSSHALAASSSASLRAAANSLCGFGAGFGNPARGPSTCGYARPGPLDRLSRVHLDAKGALQWR